MRQAALSEVNPARTAAVACKRANVPGPKNDPIRTAQLRPQGVRDHGMCPRNNKVQFSKGLQATHRAQLVKGDMGWNEVHAATRQAVQLLNSF